MFISTEQSERDSATAYSKSLPSILAPPAGDPGPFWSCCPNPSYALWGLVLGSITERERETGVNPSS